MTNSGGDPFATPVEERDPARRLRGRLASPVTGWTTYGESGRPVGITVSSIMVNPGEPSSILGLIDPLSEFFDAAVRTGRFVVHVFEHQDRRAADQLAGRYPGPDARFESIRLDESAWGPVMIDVPTRAYCSLISVVDGVELSIVTAAIDSVDLANDTDPLTYFRGHYHEIRPRSTGAGRGAKEIPDQ